MMKLARIFALVAMMVIGGQAMAQTNGALYLGASFPMKDFARYDGINQFALQTVDATQAGAAIGFNAGLKWYFNVGVKGLGVMLSLDGFYNGPNSDLKADYRNGQWSGDYVSGSFSYNATPKYINVPAMLGLNYLYTINPQLGIYAEAGVGGNMRFITEMESVGTLNIGIIESSVKTTQKYDNAFSFAFQAGLGFEIAKNLRIGCSIYNLGKGEVKGEETEKTTTLNDNISNTNTAYRTFGSIQPIMVLGRVGFSF
jgi:hypothetical protein